MRRPLALHFPALSIDLAQRRRARAARQSGAVPTSCLLLTRTHAGRSLIAARCNEAARRGIRTGLSLAEAQALIDSHVREKSGDPWVEEASDERDARALFALGTWTMAHVSPVVALDAPDGLLLDVAGTERLFGDESQLCRALLRAMHRFGLGMRIGVADTVGAAWGVARHGRTPRTIVESGDEEEALAPLPTSALRLSSATIDGLAELGIVTVRDLLALDRDRVAARFGGDVALRLDQALGRAFETVTPLTYQTPPQVERVFQGPVKAQAAIALCAEELVEELCTDLMRAHRGVTEAVLVLVPTDLPPRQLPLALARPSANARHLWTMLRPKLETAHLGFGIERVRFTAIRTARLSSKQIRAWSDDESRSTAELDREIGELVDLLGARLGREQIVSPKPENTHVPERAYTWQMPEDARDQRKTLSVFESTAPLAPRPSRLFSPPETATFDALDETNAPRRVRWRGLAYRITNATGPEKIARPWWNDDPSGPGTLRDYYRLETSCGRSLWAYREPKNGRAFIHGEWA